MNIPFCEQCAVAGSCVQDLALNKAVTGNKRIPPEEFCSKRHAEAGLYMGDFRRNVLVSTVENPSCLYPVFPELKGIVRTAEAEWLEANPHAEPGFTPFQQLPLTVTLMLTERCNLACEYCYERFSGNVKPRTMPREVIWQTVQTYAKLRNVGAVVKINKAEPHCGAGGTQKLQKGFRIPAEAFF